MFAKPLLNKPYTLLVTFNNFKPQQTPSILYKIYCLSEYFYYNDRNGFMNLLELYKILFTYDIFYEHIILYMIQKLVAC